MTLFTTCLRCQASGIVLRILADGYKACPDCGGSGRHISLPALFLGWAALSAVALLAWGRYA